MARGKPAVGREGGWKRGGGRDGPAFLGHVPMGIGISGCVNTSLSRRIEREQSETSTPAHCLRLGINKSIALGYDGRHGNRRPIRALSHSLSLSLSPSSFSLFPVVPTSPPRLPQTPAVDLRPSSTLNTHTFCSSLAFSLSLSPSRLFERCVAFSFSFSSFPVSLLFFSFSTPLLAPQKF